MIEAQIGRHGLEPATDRGAGAQLLKVFVGLQKDFLGNVLTNNSNSQVIHVALEFYQPAFFLQSADYYKLETSVKQRVVP